MTAARTILIACALACLALTFTAGAQAHTTVTLPGVDPARLPAAAHVVSDPDPLLPAPGACAHSLDGAASARVQQRAMACLINRVRARRHLPRLRSVRALARSASIKLGDLLSCGQFSHTACGRPFQSAFKRAGYIPAGRSWAAGENLAWGTSLKAEPLAILDGWLKSPEHRANLLRHRWRQQGLAMRWARNYAGQRLAAVWVSHFGSVG